MSKTVSESIFRSDSIIVPMADIQHIEILNHNEEPNGLWLITKHTVYNFERDIWENPIFIPESLKGGFLKAWLTYRHELEFDTLKDLRPVTDLQPVIEKVTRKVMTYTWITTADCTKKVEDGIGNFIQYGCDYEEFEAGPGSFSTAIVEISDGTVKNIPVDCIKFLEKSGSDLLESAMKVYSELRPHLNKFSDTEKQAMAELWSAIEKATSQEGK